MMLHDARHSLQGLCPAYGDSGLGTAPHAKERMPYCLASRVWVPDACALLA